MVVCGVACLYVQTIPVAARWPRKKVQRPYSTCFISGRRLFSKLVCMSGQKDDSGASKDCVKRLKEQMEAGGLNKEVAKKILDIWSDTGVDSPDKLRKMLLSRSFLAVSAALLQLLLDLGATYGAYFTGQGLATGEGLLSTAGAAVLFLLCGYFAAGAFVDLFTIGALLVATVQFQADSGAFIEAVRDIAGASGLGVVDKAKVAVNSLKIIEALNNISEELKKDAAASDSGSTLADLSAYLVLDNAEKKLGFDPAQYGLNSKEAGLVALEFAKFDTNQDFKLEFSEFQRLMQSLGPSLSEDEVRAALKVIDVDSSGSVEFNEFVAWWANKVNPEATPVSVSSE